MAGSIMCRSRSRTASRHPPTASRAMTALSRASRRRGGDACGSVCRSPSISSCIAPISSASTRWWRLRCRLARSRVEIAHVQYYGWALKNRAALMPSREQAMRAIEAVEELRKQHHGRIVIDSALPGLLRALSEALHGRLGPPLAQCHAVRQGTALPRRRGDTGPDLLVGDESIRSPTSGSIRRPSMRFAAPTGWRSPAAPARSSARISAAAAARLSCSPAMRARPIRSVTCRRCMTKSSASQQFRSRNMSTGVTGASRLSHPDCQRGVKYRRLADKAARR